MGQAPLDLPDPLKTMPSASAVGADDLLSQMAGDEIDRLLADADIANEVNAGRDAANNAQVRGDDPSSASPSTEPRSRDNAGTARLDTAVSSFIADGDPALEAELDSLLANLNGAPVALSDSGIVLPPGGRAGPTPSAKTAPGPLDPPFDSPTDAPTLAADNIAAPAGEDELPAPSTGPTARNQGRRATDKRAASPTTAEDSTDSVLRRELDQVFDKMTAPTVDSTTPIESAPLPGSIDLLKVLDPIVAKDADEARDEPEAIVEPPPDDEHGEEGASSEGRLPIYVVILEWVNAPLGWLSPAVRDAAGKLGILTLINAAAVLLWVLFFRRK